jgi:poly-gamma-glutamate synthesis protein (capsule biosynthesis protein)
MLTNHETMTSVRLVAVGDIMLGDSAICTGYGFASRYPDPIAADVIAGLRPLFDEADVVFGNLECALSELRHAPRDWASTQLRGRPSFAAALRRAGFNVLNVANNHASQHGDDAFEDTLGHLRDAGIDCVGVRGSGEWCSEPVIATASGLRLGFLGYCARPRQYSSRTPPFAEGTPDEMCADIARLRTDVDHVIVSLHWGEEYVTLPSVSEVALAHRLVEAGASALLGHHPHVVRPVERHRGSVIAYSLGNFVSDMIWYAPFRKTLLVSMELSSEVGAATAELLDVTDAYVPSRATQREMLPLSTSVHALDDLTYQRDVARTIGANRAAMYLHAAKNAHRFRFPTQLRLLDVTARNKISAILRHARRNAALG